jgi:hypothetical protein
MLSYRDFKLLQKKRDIDWSTQNAGLTKNEQMLLYMLYISKHLMGCASDDMERSMGRKRKACEVLLDFCHDSNPGLTGPNRLGRDQIKRKQTLC